MAEKCTNTSSPVERWINPYPFAPLNHFTVPFSLTEKLLSPDHLRISSLNFPHRSPAMERPLEKTSETWLRLLPEKYVPEKLPQSKRLLGSTTREENAARTSGALDHRR